MRTIIALILFVVGSAPTTQAAPVPYTPIRSAAVAVGPVLFPRVAATMPARAVVAMPVSATSSVSVRTETRTVGPVVTYKYIWR